jgi:cytochrome P450
MTNATLLHTLADPASRPDPYSVYARFREEPVTVQEDGTYVVSTYREISQLLHDPRISSDPRNQPDSGDPPPLSPFIAQDPPDHDRLRRLAMRQFGPPHTPGVVAESEPDIRRLVDGLLTGVGDKKRIDVVDDFAYPLPVTVICHLLGVPREDEPKFRGWSGTIVAGTDPGDQENADELVQKSQEARQGVFGYLGELVARHRSDPGDDFLSRLVTESVEDQRMSDLDMQATGSLLLVAGHETTVNLITNGTLTLLRNPDVLERLRNDPSMSIRLVEELLRFEPPVQYLPNRSAVADIEVGGTTIPKGSRVVLLLASASRDPQHFSDPERFDPDRADNQHFGFGGGVHFCFGAPLARLETQIALVTLARRLRNPRLAEDPPPYRPSPVLRGPRRLVVEVDGIDP